jgi:hypothetical protein
MPDKWNKYTDDTYDRNYYVNSVDGTTQWTPPPGSSGGSASVPDGTEQNEQPAATTTATTTKVPQKSEGQEEQKEHHARANTVLPQGWEKYQDDSTGRNYYVNEETSQTEWIPPTGSKFGSAIAYGVDTSDYSSSNSSTAPTTSSKAPTTSKAPTARLKQLAPTPGAPPPRPTSRAPPSSGSMINISPSPAPSSPSSPSPPSAPRTRTAPSAPGAPAAPTASPSGSKRTPSVHTLMPLPQFMASSTAGEYFHGTLLKFTDQTVAPSKFLHKKYWKEFFFVLQGNGQLVWYANQTKYEQKKAFVGAMDLMALKDTSTHCYGHIDEKKNKTNKGGWFGGGKNKELTGNYYFVEVRNGPAVFLLA